MLWTRRAVIVSCLLVSSPLSAEQFGKLFGGETKFKRFNSAGVAFDYPEDWRQMTVPPPTVALFTKGSETSFTVNRSSVDYPQVFNEDFAAYEAKSVPEAYPGATAITSKPVVHRTLGRVLQIDFTRPETAQAGGRRERPLQLRHFSIPADTFVYRITCLARADEFAKKHEATFNHMVDSLVITAPQIKQ